MRNSIYCHILPLLLMTIPIGLSAAEAESTSLVLSPYGWLRVSGSGGENGVSRQVCFADGTEYRQCVEFDISDYANYADQLNQATLSFRASRIWGTGDVVNVDQIPSELHIDWTDFSRDSIASVMVGGNNNQVHHMNVTLLVSEALPYAIPDAGNPLWGKGIQFRFSDNAGQAYANGYVLSDVTLTLEFGPPVKCGDLGTSYNVADITGAAGGRDCYVDLNDYALLASQWDMCTDPARPRDCYPNDNPPVWLGTSLGHDATVPPPWTPIEYTAGISSVSIWGRTYTFSDIGLPTSLLTVGQDILAAPMQFVTQINGSPVTFTATAPLDIAVTDTRAIIKAHSTACGVNLEVLTTVDFDGFARVDLYLSVTPNTTLNQFWLEVPITPENAMYKHPAYFTSVDIPSEGLSLPLLGTGDWATQSTTALYWIGGDDRGFVLAAEDDRNWSLADPDVAQQVIPESDRTTWRYRFVDASVGRSMNTPLRLTYCWQATPVKPVNYYAARTSVQASNYDNDVQAGYDDGIRQGVFHEPWSEIMGYPGTFLYEPELISYQAEFKTRGMNLCLYTHPVISDAAPEWWYWGQRWSTSNPPAPAFSRGPNLGGMLVQDVYSVDMSRSWADFIIWNWLRMIDDYGVNGAFLDGTYGPATTVNPQSPNSYLLPEGTTRPHRTIFDSREFMMRWYRSCKTADPCFYFFSHASGGAGAFTPTAGFSDIYTCGENIGNMAYGTELSWQYLRATFTGRQFGVPTEFYRTAPFTEGYIMPLMLLHGGTVTPNSWAGSMVENYQKKVWDTWDAFDIENAQWVPYWKAGSEISSTHPDVRVSYHKHPGQVLLVAATNLRTKPSANIAIDIAALGLDVRNLRGTYLTDQTLNVPSDPDGILRLNFPTHNNLNILSNSLGYPNYLWLRSDLPPDQAGSPIPANGAGGAGLDANLRWTAGYGATSHDVYFGTSAEVGVSQFKGNQIATEYEPGPLTDGQTYYWRIDEVNDYGTTTGSVWSFTAGATTIFEDDFESGNFSKWTGDPTANWDISTSQYYSCCKSAHAGSTSNDLISNTIDISGLSQITVSLWYRDHGIDDDDNVKVQFYDGSYYYDIFELGVTSPEDAWHYYEITINNSGSAVHYFSPAFRIRFRASSIDAFEDLWIDDVKIITGL